MIQPFQFYWATAAVVIHQHGKPYAINIIISLVGKINLRLRLNHDIEIIKMWWAANFFSSLNEKGYSLFSIHLNSIIHFFRRIKATLTLTQIDTNKARQNHPVVRILFFGAHARQQFSLFCSIVLSRCLFRCTSTSMRREKEISSKVENKFLLVFIFRNNDD